MNRKEKLLIGLCLLMSLVCAFYGLTAANAYTDTANCTGAALNDMRVDPSQSVTWTSGQVLNSTDLPVGGGDSSLNFDGLNDYVQVNNDASLNTGNFSVSLWAKLDEPLASQPDANPGIYDHRAGFTGSAMYYERATNRFYWTWLNGAAANGIYAAVSWTPTDWNLYTFTYSGTVGTLYINGSPITPAGGNPTFGYSPGANNIYIGSLAGGTNPSNSTIDEFRWYNRTLSSTEVTQHYQGVYLNEAGLVLYLDFDGEALDQSGEGNDGTLFNGPTYTDGWASVPVSTYFNGTISVNSRRILVNSTTGDAYSTIPDTAPTPVGVYNGTVAPDNSIGNGTITGFIVDRYEVYLEAQYEETEAGFTTLFTAQGASAVDGHTLGINDTLTISGLTFTWNTYLSNYTATDMKATPQTVVYGGTITGTEDTYGITNFSCNNTATVTWITGTLDRLQTWFVTGDWMGAAFGELFLVVGEVAGYTLILAIFSLAAYQYSGPYATFAIWLFGWSVFITQVHGLAQQMAILLFAIGVGLALAKLINDRRNA